MMNDADQQEQDLLGFYILELWRSGRDAPTMTSNGECEGLEEDEPRSTDLLAHFPGFSIVLPDKLSVQYFDDERKHMCDPGVVHANRPAPEKCHVYYFEMFVKNCMGNGIFTIGFTTQCFTTAGTLFRWKKYCYAYINEGLISKKVIDQRRVPQYSTGHTVGAGINHNTQKIFFTRDGQLVDTVDKDGESDLYPTVVVQYQIAEVTVNFGEDAFLFNLEDYKRRQIREQQVMIDEISVSREASYGIVRSYLQHYGYEDTLKDFDSVSRSTIPPVSGGQENVYNKHGVYALNTRKNLRKLIRDGQIGDALNILHDLYPRTMQDGASSICLMLHCQICIEHIRAGRREKAVEYRRDKFPKVFGSEHEDLVKDCEVLLASEEPEKSPMGYLLEGRHQENVADAVNAMILSTNPELKDKSDCLWSPLERLLRHRKICFQKCS